MSDGMSACAAEAQSTAWTFAKRRYPKYRLIDFPGNAPKKGKAILVYEDWLEHVIEVIVDRKVVARFKTKNLHKVEELSLLKNVKAKVEVKIEGSGYYRTHHYCG